MKCFLPEPILLDPLSKHYILNLALFDKKYSFKHKTTISLTKGLFHWVSLACCSHLVNLRKKKKFCIPACFTCRQSFATCDITSLVLTRSLIKTKMLYIYISSSWHKSFILEVTCSLFEEWSVCQHFHGM